MWKALRQLITPLAYLRIRADGWGKIMIDWLLPGILAVGVTAIWWKWPTLVPLGGGSGLLVGVGAVMQILVGFYVAALAAIATFPTLSLESDVHRMLLDGEKIKRRKLLAYLFGYLAVLSMAMLVAMLFRNLPQEAVKLASPEVARWLKALGYFVYQFVLWQMISITLFGIHYLSDRIHRS